MKLKELIVVGVITVIIGAIIAFMFSTMSTDKFGSVQDGNAYNATTTGSFAAATSTMLKLGQGTLGSVVIGVTSGTVFSLRDASSISDAASTTLMSLAASPVIGSTMTFDVAFSRGLFIEFPASHVGRYTVTYR